jgi:hypothetical protein
MWYGGEPEEAPPRDDTRTSTGDDEPSLVQHLPGIQDLRISEPLDYNPDNSFSANLSHIAMQTSTADISIAVPPHGTIDSFLEHNDPHVLLAACKDLLTQLNDRCHMGVLCIPPGYHTDGTRCLGKFSLTSEECDSTPLQDPSKYVRRTAVKHKGLGLIAAANLEAYQVLFEYTGRAASYESFAKWKPSDPRNQYVLELQNHGGLIQPLVRDTSNSWILPKQHYAGHINHQCKDANCMLIESLFKGKQTRVYVYTNRKIRRNTELTLDYGWVPEPCFCDTCKQASV